MKKSTLLFLLVAIVVLAGCKTQKIAPKPQPVVQESAAPSTAPTTAAPTPKQSKPANIASKEESFSVADGETANYGTNKYFVIMGSFSVLENAKRLKETLTAENFKPVIVMNENGMYRVCGNSYEEESAARSRITEVRGLFPKYSDIWLLIKK